MRLHRDILGYLALSSVVLIAGCKTPPAPGEILQSVVFSYEWVGNIDKIGFNEPSGICWHTQRKTLFVVGDEGDIGEITTEGSWVKQKCIRPGADFEGVTHDPATGLLYLAIEEAESILEVDPETLEIRREFALPRQFQGRTLMKAGGEGLEALTFVPDAAHAEGGVFYVGNQAFTLSNEEDISAVFQVELPLRTQSDKIRITGYFQPGVIDISGLHYDPATDHVLAISDAANLILEYSRTHELLGVWAFPGDNQEGITVDPNGFLYIAQDSGGIVKLKWRR